MHKIGYEELLEGLKGCARGKTVILGLGNEARGDDGFGPYLVETLKGRVNAKLFNCGTVPENYINSIVKERPDVIILLDIADIEGPVGELALLRKDDILKAGVSTHNLSPKILMELLEKSTKADIIMVGVRPGEMSFGSGLSGKVKEAAELLKVFFIKLLPKNGGQDDMVMEFLSDNEVVTVAVNLEEEGYKFYDEASRLSKNIETKNTFRRLREDEKEHYKTFKGLLETLPVSGSKSNFDITEEIASYLNSLIETGIFSAADRPSIKKAGEIAALEMALKAERDSVLFYVQAREASTNARGREMLDKIIEIEKGHIITVAGRLRISRNLF